MENEINYKEFKTIICGNDGWYGSKEIWNDASYAFQNRNNFYNWYNQNAFLKPIRNSHYWQFLSTDRKDLADKLGLNIEDIPNHLYEFIEINK